MIITAISRMRTLSAIRRRIRVRRQTVSLKSTARNLVEKAKCGWTELPPIAEYIPSASGYEASF